MNERTKRLYERVDAAVKQAMKDESPPCCKGCCHCCREPVYAAKSEVEAMLEMLTPDQRKYVEFGSEMWLKHFAATPYKEQGQPNAIAYRKDMLWCPFLNGGECMVYERRPVACRMHFAKETSIGCEDDTLREHQLFANLPDLLAPLQQKWMCEMEDGETEFLDHLGVVLGCVLFGKKLETMSRVDITAKGNDLEIRIREPDKDKPIS